jgi:curved DNA-binding protein CbpA
MSPVRDPDGAPSGAYYRRLEVGPGASHDEIVRAYRRLALGAHPDAHPNDPEATMRFREITEAYEVLGDPRRRQAYDDRRPSGHRIPVQRQRAPRSAGTEPTIGQAQPSPPPTVLGTSRVDAARDVPLRVGPVHIGPSSDTEERTASYARFLSEILDAWGRR